MICDAEFYRDRATEAEIANHLSLCSATFIPTLGSRVEIGAYAHKIFLNATRFEAWNAGSLVGLVAAYCNDANHRRAYITSVSVAPRSQGQSIARRLLEECIGHITRAGFESVELEVDRENTRALRLYGRCGFAACRSVGRNLVMDLTLRKKL